MKKTETEQEYKLQPDAPFNRFSGAARSNRNSRMIPFNRGSSATDINVHQQLQKSFKLLIPFVLYCPLWIKRQRGTNKCACICNIIGMFITVSSLIFSSIVLGYEAYKNLLNYNANEFFHTFYYEGTWIFWITARCIAVYYFWRIFKYPKFFEKISSDLVDDISISEQVDDKSANLLIDSDGKCNYFSKNEQTRNIGTKIGNLIKRTRYRIIIFVLFLMIAETVEAFQYFRHCLPISERGIYLIYWFCFKMMQIPMLLSQCIIAVIFLNFRIKLEKLRDNINDHNNTYNIDHDKNVPSLAFQFIQDRYQNLWTRFNKEYRRHLRWFYTFLVAAELCNCWVGVDHLTQISSIDHDECSVYKEDTSTWVNIASVSVSVIILMEFVKSSSGITNTFQKFQRELFQYRLNKPDLIWDGNSYNDYLYLLRQIDQTTYKLQVNVVGLPVSTENVIKFVIAFIIAKTISYSIYSYE